MHEYDETGEGLSGRFQLAVRRPERFSSSHSFRTQYMSRCGLPVAVFVSTSGRLWGATIVPRLLVLDRTRSGPLRTPQGFLVAAAAAAPHHRGRCRIPSPTPPTTLCVSLSSLSGTRLHPQPWQTACCRWNSLTRALAGGCGSLCVGMWSLWVSYAASMNLSTWCVGCAGRRVGRPER